MQKGFSVPIVVVAVVLLLLLPISFWIFKNNFNFSAALDDVKGISTLGDGYSKPGFSVNVISENGSWDFVEYLCKSLEECSQTLYSGNRWKVISGGATSKHEIVVENSADWNNYLYIKYFVKPGWSSPERNFKAVELGLYPELKTYILSDGTNDVEVVIAKIIQGDEKFYKSASFSD